MSDFACEHCGTILRDSPRGYVTECEHYPMSKTDFGPQKQPASARQLRAQMVAIHQALSGDDTVTRNASRPRAQ